MRKRDLKNIIPSDLTKELYKNEDIIQNIILSSSNLLRNYLKIVPSDLLSAPIPKVVSRKNLSLDNYLGELFLRSKYEPVDYLPNFEEHIIRGSADELSSELNPRLINSVLLGIGGSSVNKDFHSVYDEHLLGGERKNPSVSDLIYNEHYKKSSFNQINNVLNEINYIDSKGGASFDHLNSSVKSLHLAQFRHPGFVSEALEPQWKRAIVQATLISLLVNNDSLLIENRKNEINLLNTFWDNYIAKSKKLQESNYREKVNEADYNKIYNKITQGNSPIINNKISVFSHAKIAFYLNKTFDRSIASFVLSFLFESIIQVQSSFTKTLEKDITVQNVGGKFKFVYYLKSHLDKLPQRAILYKLNKSRKPLILVVHDPVKQVTFIFKNQYLNYDIWTKFYENLIKSESQEYWYTPTSDDGKIAQFIMNGTDWNTSVPISNLEEKDFKTLYATSI